MYAENVLVNFQGTDLQICSASFKYVKTGYLYSGTVSFNATGGCRLFCSALPICSAYLLLICHPQKSVTGWVGPSNSAHAMPWLLARHSTNEGVLRSNSACSMLMSDDLRLPRWGIEPRPSGFRDIDSTARPLPLPCGNAVPTPTKEMGIGNEHCPMSMGIGARF